MAAKKVIIAGAGVAGLSAAHELSKHPSLFEVHVYEMGSRCGGKAASQDHPLGGGQTARFLGEHGFRFFPWFYRHLAETLDEIPVSSSLDVLGSLAESTQVGIAIGGQMHRVPRGISGMASVNFFDIAQLTFGTLGATVADLARLAGYHLKFHASCHKRREAVYEFQRWSEFLGMERNEYDPAFTKLLDSVPMMLVAMRASRGNARTLGNVGIQMLYDFDKASYSKVDAVLEGPTSLAWIEPWVTDLNTRNVTFHLGYELLQIDLDPNPAPPRKVQSLTFLDPAGTNVTVDVSGGYCVCALPIDRMDAILTPALTSADNALANLKTLVTSVPKPWGDMIGVQYLLDVDPPELMVEGHAAYPESDWALTSVSQAPFWRAGGHTDLATEFGVPGLKGVVSVIASDWSTPSNYFGNRMARDCTEAEIKQEIWRQVVEGAYTNPASAPVPLDSHLDGSVTTGPLVFNNATPLLIHPPASYPLRPDAALAGIGNLMLAGDYVATNTELATMEGANEAAKRAVRAIYAKEGVPAPWPGIYELPEGLWFEWARKLDCFLWEGGWPTLFDLAVGTVLMDWLDIPSDFETFLPGDGGPIRVSVQSPEGSARLRSAPGPLLADPAAKIVYAPYPQPETLPPNLEPALQLIYQDFWEHQVELRRFGAHPTKEGYQLWHDVLAGRTDR